MPETCIFSPQLIGGGITAAVGWFIGYWSARRIAALNARDAAATNLRAAFAPICSRIRRQKLSFWNEIMPVVQAAYDGHAIEFEKFRYFIRECDIPAYDAACGDYCNAVHSRSITAGTTPRGSTPQILSDVDRYLNVLDGVLNFAKP
jgi:hypothetical protein